MTKRDNHIDCLPNKRTHEIVPFDKLNKKELDILHETSVEVAFRKGETIYKEGSPLTHLVLILGGFAKIYVEGNNGKNLILTYAKANDLIGGVGVFIDQRHHSSLVAITDCEICFIDITAFTDVMKNKGAFMEAYLKEKSSRELEIYNQFVMLTQKNMEGRMAEALVYFSEKIFDTNTIVDIPRQDFADYTAMSKESAIRVLKEFKDDGLIQLDNGTIQILDKPGLKNVALHA